MNFNEDKKIVNKKVINIYNSELYLDKFKTHKTLLTYLFCFHSSVHFFDFMIYKFQDIKGIKSDKLGFATFILFYYCSLSLCEDFAYIFYRKNEELGFINSFKTYNSNLFQNIKNITFKAKELKQDERQYDKASIMMELNKLEKDYLNKIGKLSNVSKDYLKDYEEIQQIKKEKKFLEEKLIQLNKL